MMSLNRLILLPINYLKNNVWQIIVFAGLSCVMVWKALLLPNCFAFDANDERNHTFVNLKAAKDIFLQGELPFMNFFNNFGTPLMGDGLTFPFSPLAITHYLLPGYLSMTINRSLAFFLTALIAYHFFSTFFSKWIATLVGVLVVFQPGFIWHAAHHHYQLSLFVFFLFMICLRGAFCESLDRKRFHIYIFFLSILLVLSVSMNLVIIILAYLSICALILFWHKEVRLCITMGVAIFAGLLCAGFEIILFFQNFLQSNRSSDFYSQQFQLNLWKVFLVSFSQQKEWTHYIGWSYFSLPVLLMGGLGCRQLLGSSENRVWGIICLVLGVLPVLTVFFLLGNQELWWKIPILRNTDIQRFHWLSSAFLMIGVGFWIKEFSEGKVKREEVVSLLCLCFGLMVVLEFTKIWGRIQLNYKLGIYLWIGILLISLLQIKKIKLPHPTLYKIAFPLLVAFIIFPTLNALLQFRYPEQCGTNHMYSPKESAYFEPHEILDVMNPNVRMVSQYAHLDLTAIHSGVLGGNGRSIILHRDLTEILLNEDLIDVYQKSPLAYVFKPPWDVKLLELLGIRYLLPIGASPILEHNGWIKKLESNHKSPTTGQIESLVLYESPRDVTPVYILDGKGIPIFIHSYKFKGNILEIILPDIKEEASLVFTFTDRLPWKILVNEEDRPRFKGSLPFVTTRVSSGDQRASLRYQPYSTMQIAFFFFAGTLLLILVLMVDRRHFSKKHIDQFSSITSRGL